MFRVFIKNDGDNNYGEKKMYQGDLNEMTILKRETNHAWLQNFTWGDLNENNNFKLWRLIIHGYKKLHRAIFTKLKIITGDKKRYYLVDLWDGSINVILLKFRIFQTFHPIQKQRST